MKALPLAALVLGACLGCRVVSPPSARLADLPVPEVAAPTVTPIPTTPARQAEDSLRLATEALEAGDDAAAIPHLVRYLGGHPEHVLVRVFLADALWREDRADEAACQFERVIADGQDNLGVPRHQLVHCHSRLMEIARAGNDEYAEHLNRGIGLYWLAQLQSGEDKTHDESITESLLCKAAGELTLAYQEKPDEARPNWYLYQVWARLARQQPARKHLRVARAAAEFSTLTPTERREMSLTPVENERALR
jgi:hypothetical protein